MSVKTVSSQADAANPLGYEKEGKLLVGFAIPCIISMLVTALYNIVDQIFIGQGVGYLGNAATNVAYPLTTICLSIALLIGIGVLGLIPPLLWQAADTGLSPLDGPILSALIYIGVGASVVSFLAWSLAIERIGMVRAGIIYNSIPLFASLEATLFLGESITLPQMIGGVLIIGGICYASFGDLYAARRLLK